MGEEAPTLTVSGSLPLSKIFFIVAWLVVESLDMRFLSNVPFCCSDQTRRRLKEEGRRRKKKKEERRKKKKEERGNKKIGVRYNKQTNFKRQQQASSNKQAGTTPHTYPAALVPGFLSDKNSADNLITFVASFEVSSRGAPCVSTA